MRPATTPWPRRSTRSRARLAAGAAPGDVAVLTRVNAALAPVQVALRPAGVPVRPASTAPLPPAHRRARGPGLAAAGRRPTLGVRADLAEAARRPPRGLSRQGRRVDRRAALGRRPAPPGRPARAGSGTARRSRPSPTTCAPWPRVAARRQRTAGSCVARAGPARPRRGAMQRSTAAGAGRPLQPRRRPRRPRSRWPTSHPTRPRSATGCATPAPAPTPPTDRRSTCPPSTG